MAPYSGNTYNQSSSNGSTPRSSHNASLALDNLIRRELKVSNPNNAKEVAEALLTKYQSTPGAIGITREAEGLPFLRTPSMMQPMSAPAETSSDAELKQAMDDVERDLKELTSNAILKDVTPELEGWATAIRSMMTEAFNAARFALDSSQRDKTFGLRRTLGDYARMARFIGALSSPVVNVNYRNLAQSIDEVTSVLLVMMGESLANVSFNRSRYLLQVPYSELQARRDSVIYALRNFLGSTQTAYAPNEWPRGVDAYRQLYKYLDDQGQGDLRSLLTENELSRIMDMLIQRASHGNVEGLRNLGATAQLDIPRLRRLVIVGNNLDAVMPASPPLTSFLQALQLFIDGFDSAGGFRLLRLARPPILFYGLYGSSSNDEDAEQRLVSLAIERNRLAELLDCFLQCSCLPDGAKCQIILDKVLYDLDRAIDLYALGVASNPEPEYRAVAYRYIVSAVLAGNNVLQCLPVEDSTASTNPQAAQLSSDIREVLSRVEVLLSTPIDNNIPLEVINPLAIQELCIQHEMEKSWRDLVQTMAPGCLTFSNRSGTGVFDVVEQLIQDALSLANSQIEDCNLNLNLPPQYEISLAEGFGIDPQGSIS
ncbi:MAG: hypothetical protein AAFV85_15905 [Cyanobacteria bacterium J06634_6]